MRLKRSPFIALIVFVIIVIGCSALYLYLVNSSSVFKRAFAFPTSLQSKGSLPATANIPKVASILDGTFVATDLATRHPLGVMIENHPDARPQSGLSQASVVYEAIAEGGITRFLAIFASSNSKVGPIRSARTYFADWCDEFDCYYAHAGGNYDALHVKIPADGIKDMDEFVNATSYKREPKPGLALEHTLYSTTDVLYSLASAKKWTTPIRDDYSIYQFVDDSQAPKTVVRTKIDINFSGPQYRVIYMYDQTTNSYPRVMAGISHVDAANNVQVAPKNIIIQYIDATPVITQINEHGLAMPTVGQGKAILYQAGQKIVGTWKKTTSNKRTQFFDDQGNLISLYRGATWVEIVNPGSTVTDS